MSQNMSATATKQESIYVCRKEQLIANSGVCVLLGSDQVAVFYLPEEDPCIYGISNWDPIGKANVLSRGIVGDVDGELVVASPLYKQHFSLVTGKCVEQEELSVRIFDLVLEGEDVFLRG